jgi:hypothetical protein
MSTHLPLNCRKLFDLYNEHPKGVAAGVINLFCAKGLPGTEGVNLTQMERKLAEWVEIVRWKTVRNLRLFKKHPADYHHSEAYFRALALVTVLQRDLGVHYNPAKIPEDAPLDADDVFIHGLLSGKGGTCANIPVLILAIAQRLHYPVYLVKAAGKRYTHYFVRWDDWPTTRFNIEATAEGMSCHPDHYYRTGMYQVSADLEQSAGLLQSMAPRRELAAFLNERGWCLLKAERLLEANDAFAWACVLAPTDILQLRSMEHGMDAWRDAINKRIPPDWPTAKAHVPSRPYPEPLPEIIVRDVMGLWSAEQILNAPDLERDYWNPLRRGIPIPRKPAHIDVCVKPTGEIEFQVHLKA